MNPNKVEEQSQQLKNKVPFEQSESYFEILRPESTCIRPDIESIVTESDDFKTRMNTFYTKTIKPREMAFLNRISIELIKLNLPKWWRRGDTLRYGYINKLEVQDTVKDIQLYVSKVNEITSRKLEHVTLGFIVSNCCVEQIF